MTLSWVVMPLQEDEVATGASWFGKHAWNAHLSTLPDPKEHHFQLSLLSLSIKRQSKLSKLSNLNILNFIFLILSTCWCFCHDSLIVLPSYRSACNKCRLQSGLHPRPSEPSQEKRRSILSSPNHQNLGGHPQPQKVTELYQKCAHSQSICVCVLFIYILCTVYCIHIMYLCVYMSTSLSIAKLLGTMSLSISNLIFANTETAALHQFLCLFLRDLPESSSVICHLWHLCWPLYRSNVIQCCP